MIEFTVKGDWITGLDTDCNLYLGQTFIDLGTGNPAADLTAAIRDFDLPNAVAPSDWPECSETRRASSFPELGPVGIW